MGSAQFFLEMFVSAGALAGVIAISKVHDLKWIPIIGFLVGYAVSADPTYRFTYVLGGLVYCFLFSLFAGFWFNRKQKKVDE